MLSFQKKQLNSPNVAARGARVITLNDLKPLLCLTNSGVRRGGLGGSNPRPPLNIQYFFTNFKLSLSPFNIEEIQENALLQLNMQFPSSWNDCRRQFNCRHHAVINDISTQSTKLNKFAISFGRPGPKQYPASGGPDQGSAPGPHWGLCQTPVIYSHSTLAMSHPNQTLVSTSVTPSIVKSCVRLYVGLYRIFSRIRMPGAAVRPIMSRIWIATLLSYLWTSLGN